MDGSGAAVDVASGFANPNKGAAGVDEVAVGALNNVIV